MEKPIQLCYPVMTLDRKELLPAGTLLTQGNMDELVKSTEKESYPSRLFMEFGTIYEDLRRFCGHPPYSRIFSNPVRRREVFRIMHQMELPQPLMEIYDYFKSRDAYTYRHLLMVFALSLLLAQDLMENRGELDKEVAAAPNHDFGKTCVPLAVCRKSSLLTEPERQQLSHHAAAGYVILSHYLKDPNHLAAVTARDHHERLNGLGYPRGIRLNNRFVEIVAVVDIFDALICARPYRASSYDLRTALEEMTRQAESGAISLDVVHALISCNRENHPPYKTCEISHEERGEPPSGNLYRGVTPCRFEPLCAVEGDESPLEKK
jgi:HD-GYP domain-containing protein (c-di-GMP phosphodiesterase class II)